MTEKQQPALILFAVGMIGLGVLALIYGDFALVWQPVAPWVPGRTALAYLAGVIMLAGGVGLLFRATASWSARLLFPYLIVWSLLKVPALVVAPQIEGVWLGFGELAVLLAGGWTLFARLGGVRGGGSVEVCGGRERRARGALLLCGVADPDWAVAHHVREGDDGIGAGVASLAYVLGVPDRRGADGLRAGGAVRRAAAGGCFLRGGHDQHLWAAGLAAESGGRAEGAAAVDRVLDYMGDRSCGVGGGCEYPQRESGGG